MLSEDLQSLCIISLGVVLATIHICAECGSLGSPLLQSVLSVVRCFRLVDDEDSKQVRRMMDEARVQHFTSAAPLILIVTTMLAVFLLIMCITAGSSQRRELIQALVVGLCIYAINIFVVHMRFRWTPARLNVIAFLFNTVVLIDWVLVEDPEIWVIQHSIRFVFLIMSGLVVMDYRRSVFWSATFVSMHIWKHLQMTESWPVKQRPCVVIMMYIFVGILSWALVFLSQVWSAQRSRACFELEVSKKMLSHLLSVFCDAEVSLGPDFQIVGTHERFSKILTGGQNVQGTSFADFLVDTDQKRFKTFIESSACAFFESAVEFSSDQSRLLPSALHVHMRDGMGRAFPAQIFHSALIASDGGPQHLLGICVESPDPCTGAPSDVTTETGVVSTPAVNSHQVGSGKRVTGTANMTNDADSSVASSESSAESAPTKAEEVILTIDPFEPGMPVQSCSFNFTHPDDVNDCSMLPKISDWLDVDDFQRLACWLVDCVNARAHGSSSCTKLETFELRFLGIDLRVESMDCIVDFDDATQTSASSDHGKIDQIDESSEASTEVVEAASTLVHLHLNGFSGFKKLLRRIQRASGRVRKVHLPIIKE